MAGTESIANEFEVVRSVMEKLVKDQKHHVEIVKDMVEKESKYLESSKETKDTIYKNERDCGKSVAATDDIILKFQETMENMDNACKRLERAELDQKETVRKLQLVEEESGRVNERLTETIKKLGAAEMKIDEEEQMSKIHEVRQITAEEKIEMCQVHAVEAGFIKDECDKKYEEVARRLKIVETENERLAERYAEANVKIDALTTEIEEKTIRTKEFQVKQSQQLEASEKMDRKVEDTKERTKLAEIKAEHLDKSIEKLDNTIDSLYDQLLLAKLAFLQVSKNLDANLQDAMEVVDDEAENGVDLTGGFSAYMDPGQLKVSQSNNEN